jgi:hypothetical protein
MGQGRILTFDEWQKAQAAGNPSTLQFPAMPKIASDRLNKTAGTALQGQYQMGPTPEQQAGAAIRSGAAALDIAAPNFGPGGALIAHAGAAVGRQVVAPAVENPALTAAFANPVGGIVGLGMAAHTVARYGWRAVTEHFMTPEERQKAEADPNRVSGEAAAVQAAMLFLPVLHVGSRAISSAADVSEGVTEAGASGVKSLYETPKGAEVLGSAAGEKGLPMTASPYPPETPNDAAWKQGHASAAPALNVAPEGAAPPAGAIHEDLGQGVKPASTGEPTAPAQGQPAPVEGTGPTRTRGLAAGVESKAVEAGLTARLGDLPEYRQLNMADQAAKATSLLQENPELARRVALGETPAPEGLHPEAAFVAVENKAIAEGDVATIRDLASSKLTEQATTMGQRIRTLGERDPNSPVSAIQAVEEARGGGKDVGKAVNDAVAELKAHIEKGATIDESAWTKFIDSIRC